jgi:hypothetical protein
VNTRGIPGTPGQGRAQNDELVAIMNRVRTGDLCGTNFK